METQNREKAEGQLLSEPLLFVRHPLNTAEQQLGPNPRFQSKTSTVGNWLQTFKLNNVGTGQVISGYKFDLQCIKAFNYLFS